jgi:putative tryptophan/tyrosine transport system substrate-binding protein
MRRREFITLLGGASLTMRFTIALAETNGRTPKVAVLIVGNVDDPETAAMVSAFEGGIRAAGWTRDINVHFDCRRGGTDPQHAASAAAEVAASKPDVVVAIGSPVVVAMQRITTTIPIVFAVVSDPVGQGVVPNLAHPGGNITGISDNATTLSTKRLDLLKQAAPNIRSVAMLWNKEDLGMTLRYQSCADAAKSLGVSVLPLGVAEPNDFGDAFTTMDREKPDSILMVADSLTILNRKRVYDYANANRLPAFYEYEFFVRDGGLMSYGADFKESFERAAALVDQIFKGAKPADLPFEEPTRYLFVINLKAAQSIGLKLSPTVLALADEVIE